MYVRTNSREKQKAKIAHTCYALKWRKIHSKCGIDCSEAKTPKNVWDDRKSSLSVGGPGISLKEYITLDHYASRGSFCFLTSFYFLSWLGSLNLFKARTKHNPATFKNTFAFPPFRWCFNHTHSQGLSSSPALKTERRLWKRGWRAHRYSKRKCD